MSKAFKNIIVAVLILAVIVGISLYFSGGLDLAKGNFNLNQNTLASVTNIQNADELSETLSVEIEKVTNTGFGTEQHVASLKVFGSEIGFSLRYVSFMFESSGFDLESLTASDWKIYPMFSGDVDYNIEVCEGVEMKMLEVNQGVVRLKCFSPYNKSAPFATHLADLAVVTNLYSNGSETFMFDVDVLEDEADFEGEAWSFIQGLSLNDWALTENKLGADDINYKRLN